MVHRGETGERQRELKETVDDKQLGSHGWVWKKQERNCLNSKASE